jgi:hypothetical protein
MSQIRVGKNGRILNKEFLRSIDPRELANIHFVDLEFDGAKERYEALVERVLGDAAKLSGKRDSLERLFEQMIFEMDMFVGGRLESFRSGAAITAERLARLSPSMQRSVLAYDNVRFPMTHLNFLSVPHPLGGENFQHVVLDRAEKIVELHETLHSQQLLLDPESAVDEAIVAVAMVFADYRDYLYLDQAIADETFLQRLLRWGEPQETLAAMVDTILQEVGPWEALPAQTLSLRLRYKDHPGLPGRSTKGLEASYDRWLKNAQSKVRGVYAAGMASDRAITPTARERKKKSGWGRLKFWKKDEADSYHLADSWQISDNRRQLFEQEIRVYAEAMRLASGNGLKQRLGTELAVVTALRSLDDEIVAGILAPEPKDEDPPVAYGPQTQDPNRGLIGAMEDGTR